MSTKETTESPPEIGLETGNHYNRGNADKGRDMGYMERYIYYQVQLYADEDDDSAETKRKKKMARAALTMWKESLEDLKDELQKYKTEARSIMNEVYQLVSLYSVFVGVVLTAVATSSRLQCQHLWSPISLSVFACSMLIIVALKKFRNISFLEVAREDCMQSNHELRRYVEELKRVGYDEFDFEKCCERTRAFPRRRTHALWLQSLSLIAALTIFTAGLVVSVIHILCWN